MKTKYDWTNVPKEVKWIATDADCVVNGFYKKPVINSNWDMWFENKDGTGEHVQIMHLYPSHINWQDSLEERPQ